MGRQFICPCLAKPSLHKISTSAEHIEGARCSRGQGLAVWRSSQENSSVYGTLRIRGSMSRRFGHSPSCLTCTRPGKQRGRGFPRVLVANNLPVAPSSSLSFQPGPRCACGTLTRTVGRVRVRRVSISFALLGSKPVSKRSAKP